MYLAATWAFLVDLEQGQLAGLAKGSWLAPQAV